MRVLMIITSDDYYRNESNHYLLLPEEVTNMTQGFDWLNSHLDDLQLKRSAGCCGSYESKVHHRYESDGQWRGPANYEIDFVEIDNMNQNWDDFVAEWRRDHPSNQPE